MSNGIRVLAVDDDPQMQLAIRASLSRAGYEVETAANGRDALALIEQGSYDLLISDQRMPEMSGQELLVALSERALTLPVIMITAYGTITQAVEAMQLGAADFISKPFSAEELERVVERVLSVESREFRAQRSNKGSSGRAIITNDPLMIRVLEVAEAVARSDATVLVQGESGTGKELVARLIHSASMRASRPFVAVNCAALPDTLLESELFGHEKGAFTGAQARKIGKFEMAQGGTILLDEVSEMALALQAKMLRVLQEREVDRVGGRDPVSIDVRVVATTNRNLEDAVRSGSFRADLFYRLNVIPITLPPLRSRPGDIKLLIEHFMRQFLGENAQAISGEVLAELQRYAWPGNIRELRNAVERAAILSHGAAPASKDFLLARSAQSPALEAEPMQAAGIGISSVPSPSKPSLRDQVQIIRSGLTVHEVEKALIMETLRATQFNRTEAANLLGISIRTLRNKLHEYKASEPELGDEGELGEN